MQVQTQELIKNAVHFGHKTSHWNPNFKPLILGSSRGVHIIDVEKIKEKFEEALNFISKTSQEGKSFLLIGTKFQVSDMIAEIGKDLNMPYVNQKWLPGFLTNFKTIKQRIRKLHKLEEMDETGEIEKYTKKEQSQLSKQKRDLLVSLGGVKKMERLPDIVIVIDIYKETIAVKEAQKLGIPIVGLVDTNGDPNLADYPIPCNDDGLKSLKYILGLIKEAYATGRKVKKDTNPAEKKTEEK